MADIEPSAEQKQQRTESLLITLVEQREVKRCALDPNQTMHVDYPRAVMKTPTGWQVQMGLTYKIISDQLVSDILAEYKLEHPWEFNLLAAYTLQNSPALTAWAVATNKMFK